MNRDDLVVSLGVCPRERPPASPPQGALLDEVGADGQTAMQMIPERVRAQACDGMGYPHHES